MFSIHILHASISAGEFGPASKHGNSQNPVLSTTVGLHGFEIRAIQPWLFIATCIGINPLNTKVPKQLTENKKNYFSIFLALARY